MKIAVVGATGLVGQKMLEILEERNFPVSELILVASEKSIGKSVFFKGKEVQVLSMEAGILTKPAIALFSAGGTVSLKYAPEFAKQGTFVIDNSSAWRMHPGHKLIVPEINASVLEMADKIIANPNCSTIQMVLALSGLHKKFKVQRIVVSTYQSVSGTGQKAVAQLLNERKGMKGEPVYPHPIDLNCLPQVDVFLEDGYTKEEMKLVNETRKILGDQHIGISATCVRVPVMGGHSESVNVTFEYKFSLEEIRNILSQTPGVEIIDSPSKSEYPMPIYAAGKDGVFVGRIRMDDSHPNTLNMWIVADNLRKGAATNAVQIAEYLAKKGWVGMDY